MKNFGRIVLGILIIVAMSVTLKTCGVIDKVTTPEAIITNYEEYENMYSTCNQICDNIRVLQSTDSGTMESGFSKNERIIALENKLNRWIREYNSKSRQITRKMWKSNALPHQLNRNDFNCQ